MRRFTDHACVQPWTRRPFSPFHLVIQLVLMMMMSFDCNRAFNIDVSSPRIYRGTPESYFGYAVELHREGDENMVLVGAPHAQTDQPGVYRGGEVYRCPVNIDQEPPLPSSPSPPPLSAPPPPPSSSSSSFRSSDWFLTTVATSSSSDLPLFSEMVLSSTTRSPIPTTSPDTTTSSSSSSPCDKIFFDKSGNEFIEGDQITNKSGQMFGATIKSSGPDGTVLVCRPLYTWFYYVDSSPNTRRFPVGGCFFASQNFTHIQSFNPCKSADPSRVNYLQCEVGFSATISETEWIIGAVGAFFGQGELLVGNLTSSTYRRTDIVDDFAFDNNYRGHSVSFGDFFGDGEVEYVTGIPRGTVNHRGLVEFRDRTLDRYLTINGHQIGSYFGHSLVVADFNDDGYDDIVISAPMYTAYNMPISDGWEVGRIHIYYNNGQGQFPVSHTISGEWPGGRFGFAMTSVDDINRDGYTDLAVSAPYFGEEKEGRVSIFLSTGSRGLSPTPSQHITPSEFGMRMTSFGFSLAGGLDVDNNTYPDLVVGSYLSSTVVLFRSRPVVDLNVTLTLNESEGIDLDERNLLLADGSKVASFRLSLCMLFTGVALPEQLNVSFTLSSITQTLPRSLFLLPNGNADSLSQILKLSKDTTLCTHHTGYIRNSIRDKLTPIILIVEYEIVSDQDSHNGELAPVLDSEIQPRKELSIPFLYDCNSTICAPDLSILASSDTSEMVVGSSAVIHLNVSISNNGEDAYESVLNFTQPNTFRFVRVIQLTKNKNLITCDKKTGRKDLVCDLGNPMLANKQIIMQLVFATDDVKGDFSNVSFILEASSAHNDSYASDNKASINANITIHSDLSFEGASESEYLLYDLQDYQDDNATVLDDEPNIIHRFVLSNRGPSNIGRTAVLIRFPHSISDSTSVRNIVELIDAEVEGGDKCEMAKLFSTLASIDDVNIHSSVSPSSPYEHPLSTSSSTQGPSQPSFGRAPARRRKRRTDIGVTNNLTLNDDDYIAFDGDLPAIDCPDGIGCYEITCHLDTVGTRKTSYRDSAAIVVTSRFHTDQFLKLSVELNITASVALVSNAEVIVHGSDYHVQLPENITLTATATTKIVALQQVLVEDGVDLNPYQPSRIQQTSIWMIIGACLMGVVILASANAILYKMGFFKRQQIGLEKKVSLRKKPDRMSLRQRSVIFED